MMQLAIKELPTSVYLPILTFHRYLRTAHGHYLLVRVLEVHKGYKVYREYKELKVMKG